MNRTGLLRASCWGHSCPSKAAERCVLKDHKQAPNNSRKKEMDKKTYLRGSQSIVNDIRRQGWEPSKKHKSPTIAFNSFGKETEVSAAVCPLCYWFWVPKNCPGQHESRHYWLRHVRHRLVCIMWSKCMASWSYNWNVLCRAYHYWPLQQYCACLQECYFWWLF